MAEEQPAGTRADGDGRRGEEDRAGQEVPGEEVEADQSPGVQEAHMRGIAGIMRDYEDDYGPDWAQHWGSVYDEVWAWWERPSKFTPAAFRILWGSFSEQGKIDYVLSLISEPEENVCRHFIDCWCGRCHFCEDVFDDE